MKPITTFLLGIAFTLLISTTTVSIMTVKPAIPKYTITQPFWGSYGIEKNITEFIKENVRKGYIVKAVTLDSEENGYQRGVVVMEKY